MKKLLWIFTTLIGLLIAAGLIAPMFISEEMVKEKLIATVQENTGRKLSIGGKFSVRFFPVAGITMEDVTLAGGGAAPLAAKSVEVDVAVVPLLSGTVDVQKVRVDSNGITTALRGVFANNKFSGEVDFAFGQTKAAGTIDMALNKAGPYVALNLKANVLDFNALMPVAQPGAEPAAKAQPAPHTQEGWSTEPIDLSFLKSFNATISIEAEGLKAKEITIGALTLKAKVENGKLTADITTDQMYGGKAHITGIADSSGAFEKHLKLENVQMEPLLVDASGSDRLSGSATITADISGRGKNQREMVESLQGTSRISILDGAIKGANIADMVRNVQSAFKQVDKTAQKTDFAELSGSFTINRGIAHNSDLAMKAPLMRLSGEGDINLPERTINYRLNPQVVETIQGQGGKDKEGLAVPIIVEGSLENPSWRPDLQGLVQETLKNPEKIKETVGTIKDEIKKKGGLKELLKGF